MQRSSRLAFLLLLAAHSAGTAQSSAITLAAEPERTVGDDIEMAWEAVKHSISSPGRWQAEDWYKFSVVSGLTVGSVAVEESVRDAILDAQSGFADVLERVGWWYGSPLFTVPFTLTTYAAGALFDSHDVRDTGLMMAESIVLVALIQQPLRIIAGRARPKVGLGHLSFKPFTLGNDYASFVSGHSWSAMSLSNILARQIDRWWASIGLYLLAGVTGWSRVYSDSHWLSDVLAGGSLGYFSSTTLWNWHRDQEELNSASTLLRGATWLHVTFHF
jgi:membrane-associated phospholipid phosphatase